MISNVVMFPNQNQKKTFSLTSPIDRSNERLVKNLNVYIQQFSRKSLLYKVYSTCEKRDAFIFDHVTIDNNITAGEVYDISFLTDGIEVIGHVISVFNICFFGGVKKVDSIITMEKCIPAEYNYMGLIEDYRKKRVFLSSEKTYFIKKTIDLSGGITR